MWRRYFVLWLAGEEGGGAVVSRLPLSSLAERWLESSKMRRDGEEYLRGKRMRVSNETLFPFS